MATASNSTFIGYEPWGIHLRLESPDVSTQIFIRDLTKATLGTPVVAHWIRQLRNTEACFCIATKRQRRRKLPLPAVKSAQPVTRYAPRALRIVTGDAHAMQR
jgi:hypothetical protein